MQTLIDESQKNVNGTVRLKCTRDDLVTGASRNPILCSTSHLDFDEDDGAYNQADAEGFIRLNALRMRIAANAKARRRGRAKASG